ncbi:MAG: deoxyribonuclease IV [Deltaproteobacteria bacterium]|nr:deoxyribonuclease IV [Deltaproteobacteria bacterium]
MLLGIHTSISKGYAASIEEGEEKGAEIIQIFVRQNLTWNKKIVLEDEITEFRNRLTESKSIKRVIAHCSYLINLASDNKTTVKRSISLLADELLICKSLGIDIYVIHPGSHKGVGIEEGKRKIIEGLRLVREKTKDLNISIAFETTAGSGHQIGASLTELADLISKTKSIFKPALCIDTAHLFAAGYDINEESEYEKLVEEIDEIIGLNKLLVCHFNDCTVELGSKKDRHQHIGKGRIKLDTFKRFIRDKRLSNVVGVLETPKGVGSDGVDYDKINLQILKSLRDE